MGATDRCPEASPRLGASSLRGYVETETVPAWAGVLGMPVDGDYSRIQAAIKAANQG